MRKLIIANWKMQLTHQESINWCQANKAELLELITKINITFIIAPSFTSIPAISDLFNNTQVAIAAQNCAAELTGAYTGQVSALSLKELNCSYCIIGHSESRTYNCESDTLIAQKAKILLELNIQPIICIGETHDQHKNNQTIETLKKQLEKIIVLYRETKTKKPIIIAYEPVWAIGTGIIPSYTELSNIVKEISLYLKSRNLEQEIILLYGGSVSDSNSLNLLKIPEIDGFLLGKASIDFQVLKKIVLSV